MRIVHGWMASIFVLLIAGSLSAAVVLEVETRSHTPNGAVVDKQLIVAEGNLLSMGVAPSKQGDLGGAMIYHGDRREIVAVDHRDRSYMVIDSQMLQQISNQINQSMSQVSEALRNVPEGQRAMVEQMMRQPQKSAQPPLQASVPEIRKTTSRAEVFGYPCVLYQVFRDGRKTRDLWVTDWANVQGGREVAPVVMDMVGFYEQLLANMLGQVGAPSSLGDGVFAVMKGIDGFPVGVREYAADGSIESESALRSAKYQRVDPATFNPPVGYQRKQPMSPQPPNTQPPNTRPTSMQPIRRQ